MELIKEKYLELEKADAEFAGTEDTEMVLDNTPDEYAKTAVQKAIEKGILKGDGNGNLMLRSPLTRQDMLVILDRLELL